MERKEWDDFPQDGVVVITIDVHDGEYPLEDEQETYLVTRAELESKMCYPEWDILSKKEFGPDGLTAWEMLWKCVTASDNYNDWVRETFDNFEFGGFPERWTNCQRCVQLEYNK